MKATFKPIYSSMQREMCFWWSMVSTAEQDCHKYKSYLTTNPNGKLCVRKTDKSLVLFTKVVDLTIEQVKKAVESSRILADHRDISKHVEDKVKK